jgi:glycosyltransferase involved in cell wall biosynthesis
VKVLHLITRLIPGGAQENTLLTVALANRERYRVHLAVGPEGAWLDRGRELADEFHLIPSLVHPIAPWRDLAALVELLRLLRREQFTIVHTHTSKAGILGRLAARLARVPVVVHTPHGTILHDVYFTPFQQRVIARAKRWAAGLSDAIITMSDCEQEDYRRWGIAPRGKFRTIYSGLDYARFDQVQRRGDSVRASLGLSPDQAMVFFPARYVPEKGHCFFFPAAVTVLKDMPNVVMVLAGEGPLAGEVAALRAASGFPERILLLGFRQDVLELMAAADVVVSASLSEGLPRAVVEALLLARPVVTTDAGGTREAVLDGKSGVLVPCADAEALAAGILRVLRHPTEATRMGANGREHVYARFDARLMVRRIDQLYQECLSRKVPTRSSWGLARSKR